jgi:hopanoid-associated phosphorylase
VSDHGAYGPAHIIVVCGLMLEARIAAGDGVVVVCSGDARGLSAILRETVSPATRGILSFGLAGGLAVGLRPGTVVVGRGVLALGEGFATDSAWTERMLALLPAATHADLAGTDRPILLPGEKRALNARTGAVAVDMESHIAGRLARDRRLPFAALRVIVDPSERAVPKAALAGRRADGGTDARQVMRALQARPRDTLAVMRLAVDAWIASRALFRCRRQLGDAFAFVDTGHHPLDVA